MEEKEITTAEFDDVVQAVTKETMSDPNLEGMSKLIVPLVGTIFASKMRKILFDENKNDKEGKNESKTD